MPYFQRSWRQSNSPVGDASPSVKARALRACAVGNEEASEQLFKVEPTPVFEKPPINAQKIEEKQSELKKAITELFAQRGADPLSSEAFKQYTFNKSEYIFKGYFSNIYTARTNLYPQLSLMCRIFEKSSLIDPERDLYIRVLRHVGRRCEFCIGTFDIFTDPTSKQIYLFQELATFGNALEFVRQGQVVTEPMMRDWAISIWCALDFLGNVGIVHRAVTPKHIKLVSKERRIVAKLSGFRSAQVYYDPNENKPIDFQCFPLEKRIYATFQAPEVYGRENEYFDPIAADVWSYGATLFYLVARLYPFNPRAPDPNLDLEIRNAIATTKAMSDSAKYFVYGCLRSHTSYRVPFEAIPADPWYRNIDA